jgi:hypothetical protein
VAVFIVFVVAGSAFQRAPVAGVTVLVGLVLVIAAVLVRKQARRRTPVRPPARPSVTPRPVPQPAAHAHGDYRHVHPGGQLPHDHGQAEGKPENGAGIGQ